jgi:hypothetical protein
MLRKGSTGLQQVQRGDVKLLQVWSKPKFPGQGRAENRAANQSVSGGKGAQVAPLQQNVTSLHRWHATSNAYFATAQQLACVHPVTPDYHNSLLSATPQAALAQSCSTVFSVQQRSD